MDLRIIERNHAVDQEIGFLTKSISKPYDCVTAKPTAWEFKASQSLFNLAQIEL